MHGLRRDEALERLGPQRAREQEALRELAALGAQAPQLFVVLDPLGERLDAERLAELDQRVRKRVRRARSSPGR